MAKRCDTPAPTAADRASGEGEKSWESVAAILTLRSTLYLYKESGRGDETRVLMEVVFKSLLEEVGESRAQLGDRPAGASGHGSAAVLFRVARYLTTN